MATSIYGSTRTVFCPARRRRCATSSAVALRTWRKGGVYKCLKCGESHYAYNSCGQQALPSVRERQDRRVGSPGRWSDCCRWTIFWSPARWPHEVSPTAFAHQRIVYGEFLKASSDSIMELALDRRFPRRADRHDWRPADMGAGTSSSTSTPHFPGSGRRRIRRRQRAWLYPRNKGLPHAREAAGEAFCAGSSGDAMRARRAARPDTAGRVEEGLGG